jgi:hypothetical protein
MVDSLPGLLQWSSRFYQPLGQTRIKEVMLLKQLSIPVKYLADYPYASVNLSSHSLI